jgi:hypothetical protein
VISLAQPETEREVVDRLEPYRSNLPGCCVSLGRERPVTEFICEQARLMPRAITLLHPPVHRGAAEVDVASADQHRFVLALMSKVAERLGEVEDRASVVRIALSRGLEYLDVAEPSSGPCASDRVDLNRDACKPLARSLGVASYVLVRRADVAPLEVATHEALVGEFRSTGVDDHVRIGAESLEGTFTSVEGPVGVHQQEIVRSAARQRQQTRPVVSEVDPLVLMQLSGDVREDVADLRLRPVCRAGVADDPVVDQLAARVEAALDRVRLVLDDQTQAQRSGAI